MFPEWQELEVEKDIKLQGKVQMKMFIPKQDKVKRLLLLELDAQVPEEEDQKSLQKWIQATLSKQKNQELGIIVIVPDLEIGHPRFRALGRASHRAGLGQQFFAALAALRPKGALDLGRPSKNFSCPRYLI